MKITKIVSVSYPLTLFSKRTSLKEEKQWFKNPARKFEKMLQTWKDFKPLRSRIEDIFKLFKTGFFKEKIHRHTRKSCFKFVLLGVLLSGIIPSKEFHSKKLLQTLAEG
jgi:hypothetical protein